MSAAVVILRCVALLAFGAPMLMRRSGDRANTGSTSGRNRGSYLPVVANFASFGLFFALLIAASGGTRGAMRLFLASIGSVVAVAGSVIIRRSRAELGAAWSFVPRASERSGLVTTGPYRTLRHPIYFGLTMLAAGQAVAFGNGPAFLVVLAGVIPSFLWRARVEEEVLIRKWGDRYLHYRIRTKMIIPYLL